MRVSRSLSRKGRVILFAAFHGARGMLACLALGAAVPIVPANAATVPTVLTPGQMVNLLPNFSDGVVPSTSSACGSGVPPVPTNT